MYTAIGTPWIWFNLSVLFGILMFVGVGFTLNSIYNRILVWKRGLSTVIPGNRLNFGDPKLTLVYLFGSVGMGLLSYEFMCIFLWMATL